MEMNTLNPNELMVAGSEIINVSMAVEPQRFASMNVDLGKAVNSQGIGTSQNRGGPILP